MENKRTIDGNQNTHDLTAHKSPLAPEAQKITQMDREPIHEWGTRPRKRPFLEPPCLPREHSKITCNSFDPGRSAWGKDRWQCKSAKASWFESSASAEVVEWGGRNSILSSRWFEHSCWKKSNIMGQTNTAKPKSILCTAKRSCREVKKMNFWKLRLLSITKRN
jgi:hypothetical protein